jgi:predicted porin
MQKKLLAVAVAGALAMPSAALAASSVTITGFFKLSWAYVKVKPQAVGETSQDRVQDESSRIYFRVVEDLGGGLQAVGQIDWRIALDSGADGTSGANWVGLRSKSWGELTIGRHDLHYVYTEDQSYSRGGSLKMVNTSILAYSGGGGFAVANATRTPNTIRWASPNWNGFTIVGAYSTNPYGAAEAEIGSAAKGGYAWHIAPQYNAKNWGIGYSYYQGIGDGGAFTNTALGTVAASVQGTSHRVNGHYQWGGFRVGVVWDRSEWKDKGTNAILTAAGLGSKFSKRDAWSIPMRYSWGKWNVFGHYSWADKDKGSVFDSGYACNNQVVTGSACSTKSKMWAIGGSYEFSKRTKLALSYAKIKNDDDANYNLFTSAGGLGSADAATAFVAGQDPSQFAVTVTHSF